jgi:protein involved in polysaccharide export with SLBB domain
VYGDGLTTNADVSRVRIERLSGQRTRMEYVALADGYQARTTLENGDILSIPAKSANLLTVFFEGAILPQPVAAAGAAAEATVPAATRDETGAPAPAQYNRVIYSFREGESLSDALRAVRASIAPLADLSRAFLVREGRQDPIYVDLRLLISGSAPSSDLLLQSNDRIVIPLLRFMVSISGAVTNPGTYPFAPNRTYRHYIDLAGGTAQDPPENVVITDSNGNAREQGSFIQAEDRIFVIPATILVQGAVFAPGSFSYRAGLPVLYYLNLAGGVDPERNGAGGMQVYDSQGRRRKPGDALRPGDRIYVPTCGMLYNLNRFSGLVVAIVTALATTITIVNAVRP